MNTKNKVSLFTAITLLLPNIWGISCASCAPAKDIKGLHLGDITLPPGFAVNVYAADVGNARSLALGDKGTLFVGTRESVSCGLRITDAIGWVTICLPTS